MQDKKYVFEREYADVDVIEFIKRHGHEFTAKMPPYFAYYGPEWCYENGFVQSLPHYGGGTILDEANARVWQDTFEAYSGPYTGEGGAISEDDWVIQRFNHWVVKWVAQLFVRIKDEEGNYTPAALLFAEMQMALDNYPVLDEELWSEMEWESVMNSAFEALDFSLRTDLSWEDFGIFSNKDVSDETRDKWIYALLDAHDRLFDADPWGSADIVNADFPALLEELGLIKRVEVTPEE